MRLRRVLLQNVRQDTVAGWKTEAPDDLFEQLLEPDDRIEIVGGGIETDDDVAAAVRQPLQDRKQNFLFVVTGTVGLDAGAEMRRAADGDAIAIHRIEERARNGRELVVGHHLGERGNHFARQRALVPSRPRGRSRTKEHRLRLGDRQRVQVIVETTIARPHKRRCHIIIDKHRTSNIGDGDRQQDTPGGLTYSVIGGSTYGEITLLERVRE